MTIVTPVESLLSFEPRGDFGYSGGFGLIAPGRSLFGFFNSACGIYQRKKTLQGFKTSRMRFYGPTNPQTTLQQANRAKIASGWEAYALLTLDEKVLLSKQARLLRLSGPNLFMRRWLKGEL